jgi:hypothetical protein
MNLKQKTHRHIGREDTSFVEMDYPLEKPDGPAVEVPGSGSGVRRRTFATGASVIWDNNNGNGIYHFSGKPPPSLMPK